MDFNAIIAPNGHGGNFWDTSWKCFARKPGLAPYSIPPTRYHVFMLSNDASAYVPWADINRAGCLVFLDSHTSAPIYSSQVHST